MFRGHTGATMMIFFKSLALRMMLILLLTLGTVATGQEEPRLSGLSLEAIFNIEIVTASKREENLWDAPGVVTVITEEEITQFGANQLFEILDRVPGLQYTATNAIGRISNRGGDPNQSSVKMLFLLDGRPVRVPGGNNSIYNPFFSFPVSMIERIEVVRGPGSVLYGTNAFEGVINVITKKDGAPLALSLGGGSFSTKSGEAVWFLQKGDLSFSGGLSYLDADGYTYESGSPFIAPGTTFTKDRFQDNKGLYTSLEYGNLRFSSFIGRIKQFTVAAFTDNDPFSYHSDTYMFDIGYSLEINESWNIDFNLTHNSEDFNFYQEDQLALPTDTRDTLLEITSYHSLTENLNLLLGGVFAILKGSSTTGTAGNSPFDAETDSTSAYIQLDYRFSDYFKAIAGAQYNKPEGNDGDTVPRLGGILNFTENVGFKLLYGEAYRSPTATEQFIFTPEVQSGNTELRPENVRTIDAQFFIHGDHFAIAATYYDSEETDLIRLLPDPEFSLGVFQNQGELNLSGFEIEGKYAKDHWYIQGSYTQQENEDEIGIKDVTLAPSFAAKAGIGYTGDFFSLGIFDSFYDEPKDLRIQNPGALQLNPEPEAVHLVSVNLNFDLSHFMPTQEFSLGIYATNLLDEEVNVPDHLNKALNSITGYGERAAYGRATLKF